MKKYLVILLAGFTLISCGSVKNVEKKDPQIKKLKEIFPDAKITSIETNDHFKSAYQIVLKQLLDHNNPDAGTFEQYMYLSHVDETEPMVLVTEGYGARNRTYELSKYLNANQLIVEYRFYGKSRPRPMPWEYLMNDQAIEDYHDLNVRLRKLYTGKWVSTGISKGGETVLIYKSKYPNDVDAAVPYVAPLINTTEDPRTQEHIDSIGEDDCRDAIAEFQKIVLMNRDSVIMEAKNYAEEKGMKFTEVPMEEALEYAVLEFPFSFWQWGGDCDLMHKASSNAKEQFEYLNKVVGISFYSDATFDRLLPSYYQHLVELGYYGFDTMNLGHMINHVTDLTNRRFGPKDVVMNYNPEYIKKVRDYAENQGNGILYIYGEYDTWGACAPTPNASLNALKMVLKGGSHATRISSFNKEDREKIYNKLDEWLGSGTVEHRP